MSGAKKLIFCVLAIILFSTVFCFSSFAGNVSAANWIDDDIIFSNCDASTAYVSIVSANDFVFLSDYNPVSQSTIFSSRQIDFITLGFAGAGSVKVGTYNFVSGLVSYPFFFSVPTGTAYRTLSFSGFYLGSHDTLIVTSSCPLLVGDSNVASVLSSVSSGNLSPNVTIFIRVNGIDYNNEVSTSVPDASADLSIVENRLDLIYTIFLYSFCFVVVGLIIYLLYKAVSNFITF